LARINPNTTLDATFNPEINPDTPDTYRVLGLQSDGKIVAYHQFTDPNGDFQRVIVRLNSDGSPDSTFGLALQTGLSNGLQVHGAARQADGQWVVVGNFATGPDAALRGIARISSGGALDASLNPQLELSEESASHVQTVAVQKDGKVLIGGAFNRINGTERGKAARLNRDGSLDTSFVPMIEPADPDHFVARIVIQADGKILIGGWFTSVNGKSRNGVARLNEDGSLDESFDVGTGTLDNDGIIGRVLAIAVQPDGKINVGGDFTVFSGQGVPWAVRLNSNGGVDTGLASGLRCLNCDTLDIRNIEVLSTGHIMISGVFNRIGGVSYNGLARLTSDGSVDPAFVTPVATTEQPDALAVGSDDKTVVALLSPDPASGANRTRLLRLNADGTLESAFQPGDVSGDGSSATPVSAIKIDADGGIIIGGAFTNVGATPRQDLARVKPDGTLDTEFDAGSGFGNGVFSAASTFRSRVTGIDLQEDGGIIVAGNYSVASGQVRLGLARFQGEPSTPGGGSRPAIVSPARAADGTFSISISGEAGRAYSVEASEDLRSWTAVGNVTGAATPQPFSDAGAKTLPHRFYRVVGQ
jgi:uncharacterized delta-60 repeat protein